MILYISVFSLLILLVIIIVVILNKSTDFFYDLYTNFNEYRLGDAYNGDAGKVNESYIYNHHINNYPKSLATEYLKSTDKKNNIKIMTNIVKNRLNNTPVYECILHLRIGDVLEELQQKEILAEWNNNIINDSKGNFYNKIEYLRNKKYFNSKIDKLKKLDVNKVHIIAGAHVKYKEYKNSSMYIDLVKKLFEDNNIKCILLFKNNPDYDILLSVNAHYFINTGGGFSKLIKEIRNDMNKLPSL